MLEAHSEKYLAVQCGGATDTPGAGEGVDLELEDPRGECLRGEQRDREGSAPGTKRQLLQSMWTPMQKPRCPLSAAGFVH